MKKTETHWNVASIAELGRLDASHEHGSMIVTNNLLFTQCAPALADHQTLTASMLDRFLHHAQVAQFGGGTYRRKDKR